MFKKGLFCGIALIGAIFLLFTGCPTDPDTDSFVAVTNITDVPASGTVGTAVNLAGATVVPNDATDKTIVVEPSNANYKDIVWSVKTPGAGITSIEGTSFTPTQSGELVLTATIVNGLTATGASYTKDFPITIAAQGEFVAVTNITGVPETGEAGTLMTLVNATVVPNNATYQTITWEVKDAGTTEVTNTMVKAGSFTPSKAGTLVLTAKIASGGAEGSIYTQEFTITIDPAFVAVTGITGLDTPGNGVTGTQIDLTAVGTVTPSDATNKTIVWSVKTAGDTGLTTTAVATGQFIPNKAGTVVLTATIFNGVAQGTNFTGDYTITIIKAVTGISGVPDNGTKGFAVSLSGATVEPADATNKTIVWSVTDAGGTEVSTADLTSGTFTPAKAGNLKLTATIANGTAIGMPYTEDFTITISEPGSFTPGFGLGDDTSITLKGILNGGTPQDLSNASPIAITNGSTYYVSINGTGYTNIDWYLNGTKQTVHDSVLYLDTTTARTIKLTVEGTKDGVPESSGTYTFTIKE
ncbi:MAG: hypothetical protein LBU17_12610 [Treponema sp.]|jgi:endo-1,4-beta-xylanase|nr:hypothetical protein [Treponema sp.]